MRKEMSIPQIKVEARIMTQGCLNPKIVLNIPEDPWDFITVACIRKCNTCEVCKKKKGKIKNV